MFIDGFPIRRRVLREIRRTNFIAFLAAVFELVSPGDEFQNNWHLEAIAWELSQIEQRLSRRLVVTMPPRQLKSIAISVAWVAWMLGHNPRMRFVCVSYSGELSLEHADMCRKVMESDWYKELFPKTRLKPRTRTMDMKTTQGGGRLATSTGGTLTGRGGEHIIIDDPIKPADAASAIIRQNCIDWYRNTLITRLNNKKRGAIIMVMQRVHEEDLAGYVLGQPNWRHLNLPGIAIDPDRIQIGHDKFYTRTPGVPLHPSREPIEVLRELRADMGSEMFNAQVQQRPIPAGGLMVKRYWLERYSFAPSPELGMIVQSWDTASSENIGSDYSVCVTALVRGNNVYILHVYRSRIDFPKLVAKAKQLAREWKPTALLIEKAASGEQLIATLRNEQPTGVPSPIAMPTTTDKKTRLAGQSVRIEAGNLFLPEDANWLGEFEHELLGFPKAKHDDQVDALVHLLAWTTNRNDDVINAGPELVIVDANEHYPDVHPDWQAENEHDPWL
jgi:predicted phage terminase large subunit-like protein